MYIGIKSIQPLIQSPLYSRVRITLSILCRCSKPIGIYINETGFCYHSCSYWGSLSSSAKLTGNLNAWLVNRDQGLIGESLVAAVHDAATTGPGAIGWRIMNASHIKTDKQVIHAVLDETIWMGVVGKSLFYFRGPHFDKLPHLHIVSTNATLALNTARATGNSSYDPTSLITVYYDQVRPALF